MHFSNHENQYFPDPTDVAAHASAFVQLMFAYSYFEEEIRSVQNAITNDKTFGETQGYKWKTSERPERIVELVKKHLPDIPETEQIKTLLQETIEPSHQRNFLVHGEWWCFNKQTSVVTVRSGKKIPGEKQHQNFTAADIEKLVETFKTFEAILFKLRRQIENNRGSVPCL